jgi:hypothetical protein
MGVNTLWLNRKYLLVLLILVNQLFTNRKQISTSDMLQQDSMFSSQHTVLRKKYFPEINAEVPCIAEKLSLNPIADMSLGQNFKESLSP